MPIGTDKNAVSCARNAMAIAESAALRYTTGFIAVFHCLTADTMSSSRRRRRRRSNDVVVVVLLLLLLLRGVRRGKRPFVGLLPFWGPFSNVVGATFRRRRRERPRVRIYIYIYIYIYMMRAAHRTPLPLEVFRHIFKRLCAKKDHHHPTTPNGDGRR